MTTAGWLIYGVVMPAIIAALGWTAVLANERYLRREDEKRKKAAE